MSLWHRPWIGVTVSSLMVLRGMGMEGSWNIPTLTWIHNSGFDLKV